MNLIYNLTEAFRYEDLDWAGDFVRSHGIDFDLATHQAEYEVVVFWNCSNVPEKIPFPLKKMGNSVDVKSLIGEWLTQDQYDSLEVKNG